MRTAIQSWLSPERLRPQLETMLHLQNELNLTVMPDWAERKLAWHRAIYVEAAEYLEHLGSWKWWKKGSPDFPQANLELVDIWHFGLSCYLNQVELPAGIPRLTNRLLAAVVAAAAELPPPAEFSAIGDETRHAAVDQLVGVAGSQRDFNLEAFVKLLAFSGMDFDLLYRHYLAKNLLNRFRQENGYKTGSYARSWGGLDDNRHLEEIMDSLPIETWTPERIRHELTKRYQILVLNVKNTEAAGCCDPTAAGA